MIRVLIVDDHELVRMGLSSYLDTMEDIEVVGEARNGEEAVQMGLSLAPDVILMDLLMPGKSGIEVIVDLQEAGAQSKVVVLTSSVVDKHVLEAVRAGALSYVLKTSSASQVAAAVRKAAQGEAVLDDLVQRSIVGHLHSGQRQELWEELTQRELDVLEALATGKNNQEIADALGIGIKTVKTHISSIFIKLEVQDRTQAAIYAIRHHLV